MTIDKTGVDDKSLDAQAHTNITPSTPHSGAYCSRYLEAQNGATYVHTHLVLEVSCSISLLNAVQTNVTPDWKLVHLHELQPLLNVT